MPGWREDLDGPEPDHCVMPLVIPFLGGALIALAVVIGIVWHHTH